MEDIIQVALDILSRPDFSIGVVTSCFVLFFTWLYMTQSKDIKINKEVKVCVQGEN